MANSKQAKIRNGRTRRKFRYPYLKSSEEGDFYGGIDDGRYGYYPTELESSLSGESSQAFDEQQQQLYENDSLLDQCSSGPQGHLLSDHTTSSIDVLILEREMKTVLTDLETLGILEDDYKSLALTTEEEEEKVDDTVVTWPPLAFHTHGSRTEDRIDLGATAEGENDWEVLSSACSVWTVETFEEERTIRDALLDSSPFATTSIACAHFSGEPRIHTIPVEMMPPIVQKGPSPPPPKLVVNLEMLERADLWSSIRDSIRGFGAR